MVTFTAALSQSRQTAVFLHLLSNLVHLLRLLACCLLASSNACRFSTSLSPRCSNFASAIHNIHAVYHHVFHLFPCRRSFVFTSRHLPMCGKEVHSRCHIESTCLNSIPSCRPHFQRWTSSSFIPPTPLPTIITLRSPTPMSCIMLILVHLLSHITQHYKLFQLTTRCCSLRPCSKRDRLQSLFIFFPAWFIHSDCFLVCLLIARFIASLIACRFSTSLSPRCSDFAPAIHNIHAVSHNVLHLFSCRRSFVFTSHHLPMCGKEVHTRRHNEYPCFNSAPRCRLHFQRRPS
jgi:hypothetical protein